MLLSQDGFCCLMYPFFLEPPNLLRNLQCRLQDVRVPTLGAQHEGKSAHILRSSRADTFSITSGVRRMLPKLLFPTFCSDS